MLRSLFQRNRNNELLNIKEPLKGALKSICAPALKYIDLPLGSPPVYLVHHWKSLMILLSCLPLKFLRFLVNLYKYFCTVLYLLYVNCFIKLNFKAFYFSFHSHSTQIIARLIGLWSGQNVLTLLCYYVKTKTIMIAIQQDGLVKWYYTILLTSYMKIPLMCFL